MAGYMHTFSFMVTPPLILKAEQQLKISGMGIVSNSQANLEKTENYFYYGTYTRMMKSIYSTYSTFLRQIRVNLNHSASKRRFTQSSVTMQTQEQVKPGRANV